MAQDFKIDNLFSTMIIYTLSSFFQFQRKNVDSHLQSNMREHLEFACVKFSNTQVQLNEQRVQLDETRVQLAETQAKLSRLTIEYRNQKRFIWKIKSFSESMRLVKEGVIERIESDPFYTGRYGYKSKVFARPRLFHVTNEVKTLKIGIVLMKGEYDDILPWPFSKKITFTIIEQNTNLKERQNHITGYLSPQKNDQKDIFLERPGEKMKALESWLLLYVPPQELQRGRFIVNDTLFLQVYVESDD